MVLVGVDWDETEQFARGLQAIAKYSRRATASGASGSSSPPRLAHVSPPLAFRGAKESDARSQYSTGSRQATSVVGRGRSGGGRVPSESWWTLGGRLLALRYLYSSDAATGPLFPLGSLVEVSYAHSLQVFFALSF